MPFKPGRDGVPLVFDDQYISTGGQLYELAVGHDLFTADLRPAVLDDYGLLAALRWHRDQLGQRGRFIPETPG